MRGVFFVGFLISALAITLFLVLPGFLNNRITAQPLKIGFVLATLQEERYQKDKKYFEEEAARLGFRAVMVSSENNPLTQVSKVENLLAMGVKALVIQAVNAQAAAVLVKLAREDNVPVVAYDRLIKDSPVDFFIAEDSVMVGRLQAEAAVKATGGKGKYVILQGQAGDPSAKDVTSGVLAVLSKYPDIQVVVDKAHEGWSQALAMATVENALTRHHDQIAAILANNSGLALGAVQALEPQGLAGKVFVAGADADLAAIKNIIAGKQSFEVLKDIPRLAKTAANVAFQLARGERPNAPQLIANGRYLIPAIATPVHGIDRSNLEELIFKSGYHPKSAAIGL